MKPRHEILGPWIGLSPARSAGVGGPTCARRERRGQMVVTGLVIALATAWSEPLLASPIQSSRGGESRANATDPGRSLRPRIAVETSAVEWPVKSLSSPLLGDDQFASRFEPISPSSLPNSLSGSGLFPRPISPTSGEVWFLQQIEPVHLQLVASRDSQAREATLPEPTSWLLLVTGLAGLAARRWLVRRTQAPPSRADRSGDHLMEPTPDGGS